MTLLGGIVGAIVGFAIGILFTEVLFTNNASWPDVVPFALGVFGWLVGSTLVRKRREQGHDAQVAGPR
jgi:hypothetical protein